MVDRTRRYVGLAGASIAAGLSGCTSVVNEFAAREEPVTDHPDGSSASAPGSTPTEAVSDESAPDADRGTPDEANESDGGEAVGNELPSIDEPPESYADVPVPRDASGYRYATVGSSDASASATVYGNWKCPYTREFAFESLPEIVEEFVRPGDLRLGVRMLSYRSGEPLKGPDAPTAARAGLAVWDAEPESYWEYFSYVFGNQPSSASAWATRENLIAFAEAAGVDSIERFGRAIDGALYEPAVRETTRTAESDGVHTVPRIVVDGAVAAPTVDHEDAMALLEDATSG